MAVNQISPRIPDALQQPATTRANASEKDMFMTLLVAQLKNQDPLQPQDGTAFVAQLAQFNSLDQLIGIRDSIEALTRQIQQDRTETDPPQNS